MTTIDYVDIPTTAARLQSNTPSTTHNLRPAMKVVTSLPHSEKAPRSASSSTPTQALSPNKSGFNIQQVLLSSTLQLPANTPTAPRGATKLLSTRDQLSIPITTVNFKRFVAKVGPVFWLQDRVEEVVMWRKGWKYTAVWMCAYAFLCAYVMSSPRNTLISARLLPKALLVVTSYCSTWCASRDRSVAGTNWGRIRTTEDFTTNPGPRFRLEHGLARECSGYPEFDGSFVRRIFASCCRE